MAEASTSYRVLPVRLIAPSGGPPLTRYLYVRPHSSPEDGLPKDRAVFVAGIPQQLQGTALVELFGRFGEIERAALHSTRVSAVLLYAAAAGRDKLMRATGKRRAVELQLPEPPEPHGLKAWVEEHRALKPGNAELQAALDEWMEEWEAEDAARRAAALKANEEEGWTVVQRHKGRKKNASASGVTVAGVAGAAAAAQLAEKAKKDHTHADFYRFQQREKRRSELLDLRERFEADKKRLADLRGARKWKPMEGEEAAGGPQRPEASPHKPVKASLNCGRRPTVTHTARTVVTAGLRRARDGLAAASIRVKGVAQRGEVPSNLVEAWRALASGEVPDAAALDALCCFTLARWGRQPLADKIAQLEAMAVVQLEHGGSFTLPRPLLRAMAKSLWADGGSATPAELSTAALRAAPFLKTPAADLARSIIDAAVHWSAELVAAQGPKAVTGLTAVLSLAPHASRTDATQRELHELRLAFGYAPEADIAEEEEGEAGDGQGEEGGTAAFGGSTDTRDALQQWERSASDKMRQEAAAAAEREAAEIRAATLRTAAARAEAAQRAAARAAEQRAEAWRAGAGRAAAVEEIQPAGYNTPPACPGHTLTTVLASPPS
ncbi:ribosomal RNA-processing [Chlorella sorokiniana]|uniref:Ribosomal RNA-processing n=1 Tax=Chlorella sorokiniana TaxID=3076 RepID=A0A2P6U0L5_CHLSO|nr:ribosomal RNA-processing [Chlorella sorokiniana]|eukprot:PRW59855.1 ribosomal RNA-processing [Chlorella sorokiniana]